MLPIPSNRLDSTDETTTSGTVTSSYEHDDRGNMTRMPHLGTGTNIVPDFRDLVRTVVLAGTAGSLRMFYDRSGKRVRKVKFTGTTILEDRRYFGRWETWSDGTDTIDTLHVMDGESRVAMVETQAGTTVQRFQLGDHLGTAQWELDASGNVLSYEEYHPYGSTAWWAHSTSVSLKRYKYTGMERDEETGLQCHGVRYYAPWLGRWTSADPMGLADGLNRFAYVGGKPANATDLTGMARDEDLNARSDASTARATEIDAAAARAASTVADNRAEIARLAAEVRSNRMTEFDMMLELYTGSTIQDDGTLPGRVRAISDAMRSTDTLFQRYSGLPGSAGTTPGNNSGLRQTLRDPTGQSQLHHFQFGLQLTVDVGYYGDLNPGTETFQPWHYQAQLAAEIMIAHEVFPTGGLTGVSRIVANQFGIEAVHGSEVRGTTRFREAFLAGDLAAIPVDTRPGKGGSYQDLELFREAYIIGVEINQGWVTNRDQLRALMIERLAPR